MAGVQGTGRVLLPRDLPSVFWLDLLPAMDPLDLICWVYRSGPFGGLDERTICGYSTDWLLYCTVVYSVGISLPASTSGVCVAVRVGSCGYVGARHCYAAELHLPHDCHGNDGLD